MSNIIGCALLLGLALAPCEGDSPDGDGDTDDGGTTFPDVAPPRCVWGASEACACANGQPGAQTCNSTGAWEPCECESTSSCVPGETLRCVCTDGRDGAQSCNESGTFDPCECSGPEDAGAEDAGMDAGAPPMDATVMMDATPMMDAIMDVGNDLDAGMADVVIPMDVAVDANGLDAGQDAANDAGVDAGPVTCPDPDANELMGSVDIRNSLDVKNIANVTRITSDLQILAGGLEEVYLPNLVEVGASLTVFNGGRRIIMPCLRSVVHHLDLREQVEEVDLRSLQSIESYLTVSGAGTYVFDSLETVGLRVWLDGSGTHSFPALAHAESVIVVAESTASFPTLTNVGQGTSGTGVSNSSPTTQFSVLERVEGEVRITNGSHVFPALVEAGNIIVAGDSVEFSVLSSINPPQGTPRLEITTRHFAAPMLTDLTGVNVTIEGGDQGITLPATRVRSLTFGNDGNLTGVYQGEAPRNTAYFEMPNLFEVTQDLVIEFARGVETVSFPALDNVGALRVENNSGNHCVYGSFLREIQAPNLAEVTRRNFIIRTNSDFLQSSAEALRDQILAARGIAGGNVAEGPSTPPTPATCPELTIVETNPPSPIPRIATGGVWVAATVDGVVGSPNVSFYGGDPTLDDPEGDGIYWGRTAISDRVGFHEIWVVYRAPGNDPADYSAAALEVEVVP